MSGLPSSRHRFALVLALSLLIAAGLITASELSAGKTGTETGRKPAPPATDRLLAGIPQRGAALGSPTAPLTLVEYADLQCPYCGHWAQATLPVLVDRYVRSGRLRIVFNGMAFVGPDSNKGLLTALAAGRHGHLWDLVDGLYERQGAENSGWVSDGLIEEIAAGVPGLDGGRLLEERWDDRVGHELSAAAARAQQAGITHTPSFQLGPTGDRLERVDVSSLEPEGIVPQIEEALTR